MVSIPRITFIPEVERFGLAGAIKKIWTARWLVIFTLVTMVLGLLDYLDPFMPPGSYPVIFILCNLALLGMRLFKQKDLEQYDV